MGDIDLVSKIILDIGQESQLIFQELKRKYQVTSEALIKVAFVMLYETVCIYEMEQGWEVIFINEYFSDQKIPWNFSSSQPRDVRLDFVHGNLNETEIILVDIETAIRIDELLPYFQNDQNEMLQQALSLFLSASFQFRHSDGWRLVAQGVGRDRRTLESFDALITVDM